MKGFTLIELLVVIGIVVILMTAALVAINPFRQFAMANKRGNNCYERCLSERG
jgi:prepilin-type N-terminal cleavage/methylation domain-containing protein